MSEVVGGARDAGDGANVEGRALPRAVADSSRPWLLLWPRMRTAGVRTGLHRRWREPGGLLGDSQSAAERALRIHRFEILRWKFRGDRRVENAEPERPLEWRREPTS